eukprot:TRINITY_DN2065_c0_g1_i1.p1 TRINITY_DN2065_c0_g1~~TRINITY_DN2065_c0_g1_i1.p1  ORF type:complete len:545 (-),score=27.56 TRINITY_DN2065_c0_g1_i1:3092-4726(-)
MKIVAYVVLLVCALTQLLFVLLVLQLLMLHRWLRKHDLTTYEYILYLRKKEENPNLKLNVEDIRKSHKSKILSRIKDENGDKVMEKKESVVEDKPNNIREDIERQSSGDSTKIKEKAKELKRSWCEAMYDLCMESLIECAVVLERQKQHQQRLKKTGHRFLYRMFLNTYFLRMYIISVNQQQIFNKVTGYEETQQKITAPSKDCLPNVVVKPPPKYPPALQSQRDLLGETALNNSKDKKANTVESGKPIIENSEKIVIITEEAPIEPKHAQKLSRPSVLPPLKDKKRRKVTPSPKDRKKWDLTNKIDFSNNSNKAEQSGVLSSTRLKEKVPPEEELEKEQEFQRIAKNKGFLKDFSKDESGEGDEQVMNGSAFINIEENNKVQVYLLLCTRFSSSQHTSQKCSNKNNYYNQCRLMASSHDQFDEIVFLLNKNKYTLRWPQNNPKDVQYILINYLLDYIKDNWSTPDVFIRVFSLNNAHRTMRRTTFMCRTFQGLNLLHRLRQNCTIQPMNVAATAMQDLQRLAQSRNIYQAQKWQYLRQALING